IPGPHSATFKYSSRIRSFDSATSSRNAVTASFTFRKGLRDDERYRFFASCWVIVLAPRTRSRCRHAATSARGKARRPSRSAPSAQRRAFLGFASPMSLDLATLRRRLQKALGKEFTVGDLLGEGGFAAVFRVRDNSQHRDVAVKVLDLGLTPSPGLAERFVREA